MHHHHLLITIINLWCSPAADLGVQGDDQRVAVLHPGQLLVAPDGGTLPPQPHLHGPLHGFLRHHPLHPPRLGSVYVSCLMPLTISLVHVRVCLILTAFWDACGCCFICELVYDPVSIYID